MYAIKADMNSAIIEVRVDGFLTPDDIKAFHAEMMREVRAMRLQGKRQSILYDYTDAVIQSQEVVAALKDLADSDAFASRRVALYSGGQLARMQATRIAAGDARFRIFDSRDDAVAWLTTED